MHNHEHFHLDQSGLDSSTHQPPCCLALPAQLLLPVLKGFELRRNNVQCATTVQREDLLQQFVRAHFGSLHSASPVGCSCKYSCDWSPQYSPKTSPWLHAKVARRHLAYSIAPFLVSVPTQ